MRKRRSLTVVAVGMVLVAASGCGSPQTDVARSTAVAFERALHAGDTGRACGLLAPKTKSELVESAGKPCPEALAEEGLPEPGTTRKAESFGTMAQVRFERDVLFLAQFQGGWKVLAAGCEERPDRPYDCVVGG
jgi:hypothetical protein